MSDSQIKIEELYDWLEQQPELAYLREQVGSIPCEYRPAETHADHRLKTNTSRVELPTTDNGLLGKLWEIVWVPGRKLRKNAFSTPELDASLSSVAKLMCISTLWDFVTTIPLFSFSLGLLTWAALPAGTALSFILLLASNVAGENSTNRRPQHVAKANWSLAAFVLLSIAKTVTSGVGVDLMISNRAVASGYAQDLALIKLSDDSKELENRKKPDVNLLDATKKCAELDASQKILGENRKANEPQYQSNEVLGNGTFAERKTDVGLTNKQLSEKYSLTHGVCRYKQALNDLQEEQNKPFEDLLKDHQNAQRNLPPLSFLQKYEPAIFNEHFIQKGDVIKWVNGSEAVGQATRQFYTKLFSGKPEEIEMLGFSLFTFSIAAILTGASSIMLYMTGKNPQVQASYMDDLQNYQNKRLSEYEKLAKKEED